MSHLEPEEHVIASSISRDNAHLDDEISQNIQTNLA